MVLSRQSRTIAEYTIIAATIVLVMQTLVILIHEFTHSPETISVWFVAWVPSSVKPGRKPFSWLVVQPARPIAVAIPSGMTAQRRRRVTRTVHLSGS